jgi:small subunit ribosomal protein S2
MTINKATTLDIESLFSAGAHYGVGTSRRHPSTTPYIFGKKNNTDIIDLEKTAPLFKNVEEFIIKTAGEGKQILFVGCKRELSRFVKAAGERINMPHVSERWVGGTLTNFPEIRKRVDRLNKLTEEKEKGLLAKYTKKERLLIDREIIRLEKQFSGISSLDKKPAAMFVVDPKHEHIAVKEAQDLGIPVIAIASTDCNIKKIEHPILANDTSAKSTELILNYFAELYFANKK